MTFSRSCKIASQERAEEAVLKEYSKGTAKRPLVLWVPNINWVLSLLIFIRANTFRGPQYMNGSRFNRLLRRAISTRPSKNLVAWPYIGRSTNTFVPRAAVRACPLQRSNVTSRGSVCAPHDWCCILRAFVLMIRCQRLSRSRSCWAVSSPPSGAHSFASSSNPLE